MSVEEKRVCTFCHDDKARLCVIIQPKAAFSTHAHSHHNNIFFIFLRNKNENGNPDIEQAFAPRLLS